ncbi:MAG: hypothetical protein ACK4HN_09860 [Thermosynechococcus sp.]|uniref:hypothetical protein n=1 Tax=Thermosynechococcus sp. TaxID=2814275 RepID=UPI00391C2ABB
MGKSHWRWPEALRLGLTTLAFIVVAFMQQHALRQLQAQTGEQLTDVEYERQNAQTITQMRLLANLPSFGFDNLVADWAFLQFLQFFGDSAARQVTGYDDVPAFFEVIVAKDPRFAQIYPYLSTAITVYAGQPQTSVALMEQGLPLMDPYHQPTGYLAWVFRAMDEFLFLGQGQAAAESYDRAAVWAELNPDPQVRAAAEYYRSLARTLRRDPDSRMAQINSWIWALVNAVSDRSRQTAIENIERLGGKVSRLPDGTWQIRHPEDLR